MVEWCLGNLEDGFFDIKFICLHFWNVYAIKGTSYNDQTLLVFSHNLGQSTVQFRTNNYGGFLVFRIKWWNGGWGTWKTVSLT